MSEYANSGVIFQCVYPYAVATNMTKIKRGNIFAPDPTYYANCALNTVGLEDETVGCLSHSIQNLILQSIPMSFRIYVVKLWCLQQREKYITKISKKD